MLLQRRSLRKRKVARVATEQFDVFVASLVVLEEFRVLELCLTPLALEGLVACVREDVFAQLDGALERLVATGALEEVLLQVDALVLLQGAASRKVREAQVALVWFVARVRAFVSLHVAVVAEAGVADVTREGLLASVRTCVTHQGGLHVSLVRAVVAFEALVVVVVAVGGCCSVGGGIVGGGVVGGGINGGGGNGIVSGGGVFCVL